MTGFWRLAAAIVRSLAVIETDHCRPRALLSLIQSESS